MTGREGCEKYVVGLYFGPAQVIYHRNCSRDSKFLLSLYNSPFLANRPVRLPPQVTHLVYILPYINNHLGPTIPFSNGA